MHRQGFDQKEHGGIDFRIYFLAVAIGICFVALLLRLWHLQIINGRELRTQSESNRLRVVSVKPPRGLLYDRNGEPLAANITSYSLTLTMEDVRDKNSTALELERIMGIPTSETLTRISESRRRKPFDPILLKENLSFDEVARIESHQYELPGVSVSVEVTRSYPDNETAAHFIGYLGRMTPEQAEEERFALFPADTKVGQHGVEKALDDILRGEPGARLIEVNALGRETKTLRVNQPRMGRDVILTLDMRLQRVAEDALGSRTGAVVALDATTGEILAFVSKPAFDPNLFTLGMPRDIWKKLNSNPEKPFNNRVLQNPQPPGSVFKIVTAIAGLESGTVTPDTVVNCQGSLTLGSHSFGCWKRSGHGPVTMHRALTESCDVYFYELARKIGIDRIAQYATALGLGERTQSGFASEKPGLIPSREWKERTRKQQWYQGDSLSAAIGQGYVLTTPLQIATLMSAVADDGKVVRPQIVKGIKKSGPGEIDYFPATYRGEAKISRETLNVVRSGLKGVVNEGGGTAASARSHITTIAGKTGTAQVVSLKKGMGSRRLQDHAWFAAYAPADNPAIAVAVIVEHGGHGGAAAAPVARAVIDAYFTVPRAAAISSLKQGNKQDGQEKPEEDESSTD